MGEVAEIIICGAGIAGISAAYHLAVRHGFSGIVLLDESDPLSLTSDKSTECYRNWWPGEAMISLMNRSIDLLEELAVESRDSFHLNRRGYLYLTADPARVASLRDEARAISALGAGPLRVHSGAQDSGYQPSPAYGFAGLPEGADLLLDSALRRHFPYLSPRIIAGLHVRRAGWFSAQQLGSYLLDRARACGVVLRRERVVGVETGGGRVQGVRLAGGGRISTSRFVNAAGPLIGSVGRMLNLELPIFSELHMKLAIKDEGRVVPRDAPLLILNDPQRLPWTEEERLWLAEDEDASDLLGELPPGAHLRPEGGEDSPVVLLLWEFRKRVLEPVWPLPLDPAFPDVALRGLAALLPGLARYIGKAGRPALDGGYYTKTRENMPLIGPLPVEGAYLIGALSGFGLMAAMAAGELLAAHILGEGLPPYAPAFSFERYADPLYRQRLAQFSDPGQL